MYYVYRMEDAFFFSLFSFLHRQWRSLQFTNCSVLRFARRVQKREFHNQVYMHAAVPRMTF